MFSWITLHSITNSIVTWTWFTIKTDIIVNKVLQRHRRKSNFSNNGIWNHTKSLKKCDVGRPIGLGDGILIRMALNASFVACDPFPFSYKREFDFSRGEIARFPSQADAHAYIWQKKSWADTRQATRHIFHSYVFTLPFRCPESKYISSVNPARKARCQFKAMCHITAL